MKTKTDILRDAMSSVNKANLAKQMNLAEWRMSMLHEMDLPSGLPVTVRDVTMTDLLLTGKLPPSFVDMAQDAATKGSSMDLKQLAENGTEFRSMLDALVEIALVIPLISTVADDSHITLAELPNDDKIAIFNFVNREVTALQSFREGQNEPVAAV
jgi:hypothetical protein